MITLHIGATNFPECKGAELAIKGFSFWNKTEATEAKAGMMLLGLVEEQFSCAKFCGTSPYFTFSNVS